MAPPRMSADVFWQKVEKTDTCWRWTGAVNTHGYGQTSLGGRQTGAHRLAWRFTYGPIPPGLSVLHRCDNPPCVRPDHLFLGTVTDNAVDMMAKGRGRVGSRHGKAKLTEEIVREMRRRHAMGERYVSLAAAFGVTPENVSTVCRRLTWTHV